MGNTGARSPDDLLLVEHAHDVNRRAILRRVNRRIIRQALSIFGKCPRLHLVRLPILTGIVERADDQRLALPFQRHDPGRVAFVRRPAGLHVYIERAFPPVAVALPFVLEMVALCWIAIVILSGLTASGGL